MQIAPLLARPPTANLLDIGESVRHRSELQEVLRVHRRGGAERQQSGTGTTGAQIVVSPSRSQARSVRMFRPTNRAIRQEFDE